MDAMIGTTVGKYRVIALLGRGATGIVYRAIDDTLDREVAIKVLNPVFASDDIVKRFRSEATTLAKLSHPEIATIHELLRTDTNLFMVMELVRGETLDALAERSGPMSPELAGHILDGILSALEHAHRAGIVHRDLKPANVMVTTLGGIKIMDFGIARVRGSEHLTLDGCAVGTPGYMSPEQVLGEDVDGRADLYAVGVILYRLLAGRLPFEADSAMAMLQKHVSEPPPPLRTARHDLPDWCDSVLQRALAKAPADRFQTAGEFRAAVGRALGLTPALDLATAFAVSTTALSIGGAESQPLETLTIAGREATLGDMPPQARPAATVGAWLGVVAAHVVAVGRRTRKLAPRSRAALVAGLCGMGVVVYLSTGISAPNAEPTRRSESGSRIETDDSSRDSRGRASSVTSAGSTPSARADRGAAEAAVTPLIFRAKLVVRDGEDRREEEARLSFARERLSVTANDAPSDPVFSVPYGNLTAIEHSRQPAWRPPQKWSRVVKIGDEVLEKIGVRDRHEISLRTESDFVLLRVEEEIVNRVLRTLRERTGLNPDGSSRR